MPLPTLSEEIWRFLVVYEHHAGTRVSTQTHSVSSYTKGSKLTPTLQINLQAAEKASGLTYKTLWGKMDKAKKALKAEGFDFNAAVEKGTPKATPKKAAAGKRKAKGDAEDDEEASPSKKGKQEVKIKDEFQDEDETE